MEVYSTSCIYESDHEASKLKHIFQEPSFSGRELMYLTGFTKETCLTSLALSLTLMNAHVPLSSHLNGRNSLNLQLCLAMPYLSCLPT